MAKVDPQVQAHHEWLGFVQPVERGGAAKPPPPGLVLAPTALLRAGAVLPRSDIDGQRALIDCLEELALQPGADAEPVIADFEAFARRVLDWSFSPKGYGGMDGTPLPEELEVVLADLGETLRPDLAVRELKPVPGAPPWQLVVRVLEPGQDLDRTEQTSGQLEASPHGRMERLLRETGVTAGLLCNGTALRLVSAPRGESSGWLEFRVTDMAQTAGRPIAAALRLLLNERRLLTLPSAQRLGPLLADSRRYQNEVSEKLAEQVLHALYELLRGLQAADGAADGELLRKPLDDDPDQVYAALLNVILRMLFVLYAEEREMLPDHEAFTRFYSLAGLFERLRDDAARYPDTMDQRYGAWAQLLVLFRMVHDGAQMGEQRMPPRHGGLFDPDRYPFLEGRTERRQAGERVEPPLVPDGTVLRALEKLLVLDGERLSYRALDVEQIGSVYETMMGFRLQRATGRSLAVKAAKARGAPSAVDLDALMAEAPAKRSQWLKYRADRKLTPRVAAGVKAAETMEDLHAALLSVADRMATPDLVPAGALLLQPSEERRRSGSHYTPRSLTEPIVRTTLAPVLDRLRSDAAPPRPEAILDLKVCDPAIGSGAFLVEACRQLADALIEAWAAHGGRPELPVDEDEVVYARRLVAQRCLYGVDKNSVAVDLAKLSLWLVTLAREHAFTFLDHALRHGDSLVGLSRQQIEAFHWKPGGEGFEAIRIRPRIVRAAELRTQIREAGDEVSDVTLRGLWDDAQHELRRVRLIGDLAVIAFFAGSKAGERETKRTELAGAIAEGREEDYRWEVDDRRAAESPLVPLHWEVEFPEVFDRERPGFDAVLGNPPFAGKNSIINGNAGGYLDWLKALHDGSHGNADLVAHFFRRGFDVLRDDGTFGLIATNTIGQGDTRATGLRAICRRGGVIYNARKRYKWPGLAAVVVSVVHVSKGQFAGRPLLDGLPVDEVTAFLFHRGGHDNPAVLKANASKSFAGFYTLGKGFTFDDTDGDANSVALMTELLEEPKNAGRIHPYMGGEEINEHPVHRPRRWVIDFETMSVDEAASWPELLDIVAMRVKPGRLELNRKSLRDRWWQFAEVRPGLRAATAGLTRVLATSSVSKHRAFAFVPSNVRLSHNVTVVAIETQSAFAVLQSRAHEIWASFFSSSLEDRSGYRPSDCFETFPFPKDWTERADLEAPGRGYYDFRAALMVERDEGLTKPRSTVLAGGSVRLSE